MRIVIRAAMDMPLLPAECAKYSELSGVQLKALLQQIEQDVRCRLKEISSHPVHPGTEITASVELVDAYVLRAKLPEIPKLPPQHHGHFLCNGQYLLPDGKITGDPMPGFMDYRPMDSVERQKPQPPAVQVQDCGCTAGNHRPTCRWYSPTDRSPEYPPGYCIHGVHPGLRCNRCGEWQGGGQG